MIFQIMHYLFLFDSLHDCLKDNTLESWTIVLNQVIELNIAIFMPENDWKESCS